LALLPLSSLLAAEEEEGKGERRYALTSFCIELKKKRRGCVQDEMSIINFSQTRERKKGGKSLMDKTTSIPMLFVGAWRKKRTLRGKGKEGWSPDNAYVSFFFFKKRQGGREGGTCRRREEKRGEGRSSVSWVSNFIIRGLQEEKVPIELLTLLLHGKSARERERRRGFFLTAIIFLFWAGILSQDDRGERENTEIAFAGKELSLWCWEKKREKGNNMPIKTYSACEPGFRPASGGGDPAVVSPAGVGPKRKGGGRKTSSSLHTCGAAQERKKKGRRGRARKWLTSSLLLSSEKKKKEKRACPLYHRPEGNNVKEGGGGEKREEWATLSSLFSPQRSEGGRGKEGEEGGGHYSWS